jgi:hypothetical protein
MMHCSRCGQEHQRINQHYCAKCHAAYMREWRKTHPLTGEAKRKSNVRSFANAYQSRGLIEPQVCEMCGEPAEKHHDDYNQPLNVRWLCRPHHLDIHSHT